MKQKVKLIPFHDGQKKILSDFVLDDSKKFGVVCVGRQWGKSLMSMNVMIAWMMNNPGSKGGWVTPYAKHWAKAYKDIVNAADPVISGKNKQEGTIRFISGSELSFLSTENEDGVRGFTFDYVVVDEAGFVKTNAYENLAPTWNVQGKKVMFISTPGIKNWFWTELQKGFNGNSRYASFKATSYDNPYIDKSELDDKRKSTDSDKFKQEYLAEFSDASGGVFIGYDGRCLVEDYVKSSEDQVFMGIDIARGGKDSTSITVMDSAGKIINREYWNEWDTEKQISMILELIDRFPNLHRVYIEENQEVGIFQAVRKALQHNKAAVRGFYTTRKNKPQLIQNLARDIEQGDVILPTKSCDSILFDEFGDFTFKKSEDGYIKYSASDGKHDDSVISTALANEARLPNRHVKRSWLSDFKKWNN